MKRIGCRVPNPRLLSGGRPLSFGMHQRSSFVCHSASPNDRSRSQQPVPRCRGGVGPARLAEADARLGRVQKCAFRVQERWPYRDLRGVLSKCALGALANVHRYRELLEGFSSHEEAGDANQVSGNRVPSRRVGVIPAEGEGVYPCFYGRLGVVSSPWCQRLFEHHPEGVAFALHPGELAAARVPFGALLHPIPKVKARLVGRYLAPTSLS